jgi:hypothetical protein
MVTRVARWSGSQLMFPLPTAHGTTTAVLGKIDPRAADALESSATDAGSDPAHWRLSYRDVPVTQIVTIERKPVANAWCRIPPG